MLDKFKRAISKVMVLGMMGGLLATSVDAEAKPSGAAKNAKKAKTTAVTSAKKSVVTSKSTGFYNSVKINTQADLEKLFDRSLQIIYASLILEEVPMPYAYDDHGMYRGKKNTVGCGSTFAPESMADYNKRGVRWYKIHHNPKTFAKGKKYSSEDMLRLIIGWGQYRTVSQHANNSAKFIKSSTILEKMFKQLKGASLRPNEFAALYCAVYNNETNITKLCPYIAKNYSNPIACANKIKTWSGNTSANGGHASRCLFESLVYLNADGFCEKMLDLRTSSARRASCINSVKRCDRFTRDNYRNISKKILKKYSGYVYKEYETPRRLCKGLGKYFVQKIGGTAPVDYLQQEYLLACKTYDKKQYAKALNMFLALEKKGGTGVDLFNDIALTYFKLKDYDNCIEYSQKVLTTAETGCYAPACHNAAFAYEKKGDYKRAKINRERAIEYYEKYGVYQADENVDYNKIYKSAYDSTMLKLKQSTR